MTAKEWFEKSGYEYKLEQHDEGGYIGIDEYKVAEMLDSYHEYKLKLLGIANVVGQGEQLFCHHEGKYTLKSDGNCCKCHLPPRPTAK